jgi:hypothetical protein
MALKLKSNSRCLPRRSDDPPLLLRLDVLRQTQTKIRQPMACCVFGVLPERWPPSFVLPTPIATFEFGWHHSRQEFLPPSAPGVAVEVMHQDFLHIRMVDVPLHLRPVLLQIVISHRKLRLGQCKKQSSSSVSWVTAFAPRIICLLLGASAGRAKAKLWLSGQGKLIPTPRIPSPRRRIGSLPTSSANLPALVRNEASAAPGPGRRRHLDGLGFRARAVRVQLGPCRTRARRPAGNLHVRLHVTAWA